LKEGAQSGL